MLPGFLADTPLECIELSGIARFVQMGREAEAKVNLARDRLQLASPSLAQQLSYLEVVGLGDDERDQIQAGSVPLCLAKLVAMEKGVDACEIGQLQIGQLVPRATIVNVLLNGLVGDD